MSNEKMKVPTLSVGLDKRRILEGGFYNASLIISFDYKRKYFHLTDGGGDKFKLKEKDLRKREVKDKLEDAIERARRIIKEMPKFSFKKFEVQYYSDRFDETLNLVNAIRNYANSIPDARLKTKLGYETVANIVEAYSEGNTIEMHEVSTQWLTDFETYLTTPYMKPTKTKNILKPGRSYTTVGFYMRNIRAVVLHYIKTEKPKGYENPFVGGYEIPSGQNTKKALSFEDISRIYHFDLPSGSKIEMHRDLWLLSYMASGANMKDIARLKYRNIDIDKIVFLRSKTVNTKRGNQREVVIPLTAEIARIIDRWKVPGSNDDYILPILNHGLTPMQELNKIQGVIKRINRDMKEIATKLGIQKDVNTYAARHSFATIAMQKGASVAMISKSLGHSNIAITESYLGSFEDKAVRDLAEKLSNFDVFSEK